MRDEPNDRADAGILDEYLDGDEGLGREIDKAPRTIARWRSEGQGPPVTRLGRRILYHRDDVRKWLREQATK